jgi:hypothetical protein
MCKVDSSSNLYALLSWQNFILAKSGCYNGGRRKLEGSVTNGFRKLPYPPNWRYNLSTPSVEGGVMCSRAWPLRSCSG